MSIVFSASLFVSAALLFLVELIVGKMLLPLLGGTPSVWNTCLVFFQAMLLAGYLYAWAAKRWLGRRTQFALQAALALGPIAVLPLHLPHGWEPPSNSSPIPWLLLTLLVAAGAPFFVLSSATPVLQRWFSHAGQRASADPYFLYAASNTGSLLGLLSYPLLIEPSLGLGVQSRLWSCGYILFAVMTLVCGMLAWRAKSAPAHEPAPQPAEIGDSGSGRPWPERMRWIALAFVPSSLMIGTTTALSTDVPPIPLFWVLPLALYLLSFVLVFARRQLVSLDWVARRLPFFMLAAILPTVTKTKLPLAALLPIDLLTLFLIALLCHGLLARSRPPVSRLEEFYLCMSVGGVLGGIFNSLVAPVVFPTVVEYPLALIFAALLRPRPATPPETQPQSPKADARARRNDWLLPLAMAISLAALIAAMTRTGLRPGRELVVLIFAVPAVWCLSFGKRPLRFAAGLAALLAAGALYSGPFQSVIHTERDFFGVSRVSNDSAHGFRYLFHGGTAHGLQSLDPARASEIFGYYTRSGPAGSILAAAQTKSASRLIPTGPDPKFHWAVVGLGAGAMACYLQPGGSLTYYEIDPVVKRIASNPEYFSYVSGCAPAAPIVLGDARLKLHDAPDGSYDLIVLDAFSGDMIPMHLMTREALGLYLRKLAPGGMIAFHISNLYLDLAPTLGALAHDSGLVCMAGNDSGVSQAQIDAGRFPSQWVVMARAQADLGELAADPRWKPATFPPSRQVWTDDYSNLLQTIKWN